MENLNEEQIIKALECCYIKKKCIGCPMFYNKDCYMVNGTKSLALIKELTDENERLHASCTELEQKCASVKSDTVRKMQERLKERKVSYGNISFRVVPIEDIDQIANELLEESDET